MRLAALLTLALILQAQAQAEPKGGYTFSDGEYVANGQIPAREVEDVVNVNGYLSGGGIRRLGDRECYACIDVTAERKYQGDVGTIEGQGKYRMGYLTWECRPKRYWDWMRGDIVSADNSQDPAWVKERDALLRDWFKNTCTKISHKRWFEIIIATKRSCKNDPDPMCAIIKNPVNKKKQVMN
jgi:hypothetical protein